MVWDVIERVLKIAGIVGAAAAAGGVWLQLRDLNDKDFQRRVENWQASAVYKIIEDGTNITFDEISRRYLDEAQQLPSEIPRNNLTKEELQLVILRLMQGQSIVETLPKTYSIKLYTDPQRLFATELAAQSEFNNKVARHIEIVRQIFYENEKPMTVRQFQDKIIAAGGSDDFVKQNSSLLLETIQNVGLARVANDMVTRLPTPINSTPMSIPSDLTEVIGHLSSASFRFIMGNNTEEGLCFQTSSPEELASDGVLKSLERLEVIELTEVNVQVELNKMKCVRYTNYKLTTIGARLKNYLFETMESQIVASFRK